MSKGNKKRRVDDEISKLEKEIEELLRETGLISHIKFHNGDLEDNKDPENPRNSTYFEYSQDNGSQKTLGNCGILKRFMLELIAGPNQPIYGLDYYTAYEGRVKRIRPLINEMADILDEGEFSRQTLCRIRDGLKVYTKKYSKSN